ncbi:hypothetical protein BGZ61DRAFT_237603 [Ilyonectria robusta]|uniref:uncharacterized protein n=1 Tax=Ilyonectria robusta TaxID=1079257 RepID=UPI001E8DB46F|nr:uncharacterized protein BGZ61DRAFT_237603 [Ilyonectria robusta]KAH8699810.1 hypothetical protein BGZ61DRAFT_237603 [Ilyonectria robusta]
MRRRRICCRSAVLWPRRGLPSACGDLGSSVKRSTYGIPRKRRKRKENSPTARTRQSTWTRGKSRPDLTMIPTPSLHICASTFTPRPHPSTGSQTHSPARPGLEHATLTPAAAVRT